MRHDEDFFGEQELALIYIAKRLSEAKKMEKMLTEAGIDYLVEPDTYRGGFIFVSERIGAFFYTTDALTKQARALLTASGYKPYQNCGNELP